MNWSFMKACFGLFPEKQPQMNIIILQIPITIPYGPMILQDIGQLILEALLSMQDIVMKRLFGRIKFGF